jgi:cytoskeletal protein RodZ
MVYQKGFIRIYAKVVGIDSEALIARYNQIASVQLAINSASEENNPKEKSRLKKVTNKVLNGLGFRFGH